MWIGRPRLGQQIVPVVEDGHQRQIGHRREGCCPGAGGNLHLSTAEPQVPPVPFGRTEVGGQRDEGVSRKPGPQRGIEPVQIPRVRHHQQGATTRGERDRCRFGQSRRPVLAGKRLPDGADRPSFLHRRQERVAGPVALPSGAIDRVRIRPVHRRGCRQGLLDSGVPGRNGQPQHVGHRPGVAIGDRPRQHRDLRGENRLGRDHPLQKAQPALVLRDRCPLQHIAIEQPPGEPHPDPATRLSGHRVRLADLVVEGPIQMGQRHVDRDPGDGQVRCDHLRPDGGPSGAGGGWIHVLFGIRRDRQRFSVGHAPGPRG